MRPSFIVVPFPIREKFHTVVDGNEAPVLVVFLFVGSVRPLHLAVVGLDLLHGEGKHLADLLHELDCAFCRVVVIDAKDPVAGAVVDRGELLILLALQTPHCRGFSCPSERGRPAAPCCTAAGSAATAF